MKFINRLKKRSLNQEAAEDNLNLLDIFVVSIALTILGIRLFLEITGYPQIGGDNLHIAHMLWGGLAMMVVMLYLLFATKPNKYLAALIGGIGFGFFIDEIGKFVTSDNDYFFSPSAFLMYVIILLIYVISRIGIVWFYSGSLVTPAHFPEKRLQKWYVVLVAAYDMLIAFGFLLAWLSGFRDLIGLDLPLKLIYGVSVFLAFVFNLSGLYMYLHKRYDVAASNIRKAGLIVLLVIYPVLFYRNEFSAAISCMLTFVMILTLSTKSIRKILQPIFKS